LREIDRIPAPSLDFAGFGPGMVDSTSIRRRQSLSRVAV
jgi:hypothetical protein